jgi:hypothetical protein
LRRGSMLSKRANSIRLSTFTEVSVDDLLGVFNPA